jgi:hypothetical protein
VEAATSMAMDAAAAAECGRGFGGGELDTR